MPRKSKIDMEAAAKEAAWYATPAGRKETQREFERAIKKGTILRSEGVQLSRTDARLLAKLLEQAKANATKAISIRLSVADLERAKQIAAKQGVGYQTVLKQAIRTGLKKAS